MDRLTSELKRLYLPAQGAAAAGVRAMVLELARPAGWQDLGEVWQGVQRDLQLPAPAIAVSGSDAYQLWFSLEQPVDARQAQAFLEGLRARYLAGVAPERVRLHACDGAQVGQGACTLPPRQVGPERWSAFVAPDLAPLFAEEPWLDQPPGADAQAELLSQFESMRSDAFQRACAALAPREDVRAAEEAAARSAASPAQGLAASAGPADPRAFLLAVMQDPTVDLRLRIEAAKALLSRDEGAR